MRRSGLDQELRLTRALTLAVARAADLSESLEAVLAILADEGGWDLGRAWNYDPASERLEPGPGWLGPDAPPAAAHLLERTAEWDAPLWMEAGDPDDPRVAQVQEAG